MDCGNCTACCKNLELHEVPSKIGELCRFCTEGKGCQIYEERPQECAEFLCMWAQMEEVGEELRPDKCGVIFSRQGDDVIAARVDADTLMTQLAVNIVMQFVIPPKRLPLFESEQGCALSIHDIFAR